MKNEDRLCMLGREGKSVEQGRARVTVMCDHVTVTDWENNLCGRIIDGL